MQTLYKHKCLYIVIITSTKQYEIIFRIKTTINYEQNLTSDRIKNRGVNNTIKNTSKIWARKNKKIILNPNILRLRAKIRKIKIKKIFLDSSPHDEPAQKGEGVRVKNVCGIYSAGKYSVLAICVRTQNDFYLKGGISVHLNNKTRLKRLIFVYNGHYTRKRNRNTTCYV